MRFGSVTVKALFVFVVTCSLFVGFDVRLDRVKPRIGSIETQPIAVPNQSFCNCFASKIIEEGILNIFIEIHKKILI